MFKIKNVQFEMSIWECPMWICHGGVVMARVGEV